MCVEMLDISVERKERAGTGVPGAEGGVVAVGSEVTVSGQALKPWRLSKAVKLGSLADGQQGAGGSETLAR
jgi:hypothetical protein